MDSNKDENESRNKIAIFVSPENNNIANKNELKFLSSETQQPSSTGTTNGVTKQTNGNQMKNSESSSSSSSSDSETEIIQDEDCCNYSGQTEAERKKFIHFHQQFSNLDTIDNDLIKTQWREDAKKSRNGSLKLYILDNRHYLTRMGPKIQNDGLTTTLHRKTPWRRWDDTDTYCQPFECVDKTNIAKVANLVVQSIPEQGSKPLFDAVHLSAPIFDNDEMKVDVLACISTIAHINLTKLIVDLEIFAVPNTRPLVSNNSLHKLRYLKISIFSYRCPPDPTKYSDMFLNCWAIAESITKNTPAVDELIVNWLIPYSKKASFYIPHFMEIASTPSTFSLAAYGGIKEMCILCMSSLSHNSLKKLCISLAYPDEPDCIAFTEQLLSSQSKSLEFLNIQMQFEEVRTRNVHKILNLPSMCTLETLQLRSDVVEINLGGVMNQMTALHLRLYSEKTQGWRDRLVQSLYWDKDKKLFKYELFPKLASIVLHDK